MNEDIVKRLALLSGLEQGQYANADAVRIWKENVDNPGALNKFAEMIVRECALIAQIAEPWKSDDLILKHFGLSDELYASKTQNWTENYGQGSEPWLKDDER